MFTELPFDVLHQIARRLDISSHNNLSETCHTIHEQLRDDNTARPCVERSIPHSTWGRLSSSPSYGNKFRQLADRYQRRKESLQLASPYSITIIGHATSFVYNSGVLCYSDGDGVRILDFNSNRHTEKVLSSRFFSSGLASQGTDDQSRGLDPESLKSVQVCNYADKIIVCVCNFGAEGNFLFAVNIDEEFEPSAQSANDIYHHRILLCIRARSTSKLFVRHDRKHLVYGTHSARGHHDHHEWLLEVYDLSTAKSISKEPFQLSNFYGSELGSTVCFTVFEGQFYAVTNLTSLESEEVDWTSYYHFISFPLDEPCPNLRIQVIWRRQHVEGPINDAWTSLEFQQDHRTGELLIIECRKEWINGGSRCIRTFYTQPFHRAEHQELDAGASYPPNDPLRRVLEKGNNSRYEVPRPRARKYVHTEAEATGCVKEYIRAKTKYNGYCFNAQSIVDIVTEEVKVEGEWRARERIKIRVVSRNEISPLVTDEEKPRIPGGLIIRPRTRDRDGEEMLDGEEDFSPSHVTLWPADDAPQAVHEILCPGGRAGNVKAVLGEEGLVYMAGPDIPGGRGTRALVFVSFDPTFGFEGMTRLDGTPARCKMKPGVPTNLKKRKSVSDSQDERDEAVETAVSHKGKERETPDLPDHTKRLKIHELDDSDGKSLCMGGPSLSITSMAALASTPAAWPPPLVVHDQTLQVPSSLVQGQNIPTGESSSSASHSRHASNTSSGGSTSATSLTSSAGLLTWRERAAYINIGRGIWTK